MPKVLLGFMGAGKTTVASLVQGPHYEMDELIGQHVGMPVSTFFREDGEEAFRAVEAQILAQLLEQAPPESVISTGGGIVMTERNRALLLSNRKENILLTASFDVLYERLASDQVFQRSLFLRHTKEELEALFRRRIDLTLPLVDTILYTDRRTPEELARIITCL